MGMLIPHEFLHRSTHSKGNSQESHPAFYQVTAAETEAPADPDFPVDHPGCYFAFAPSCYFALDCCFAATVSGLARNSAVQLAQNPVEQFPLPVDLTQHPAD